MGAPGSGAGSVLLQQFLLTNVNQQAAVSAPLTAYGAIGVNDSGGYCGEGRAFKKATILLEQVGSTALAGGAVSVYGTASPNATQTWFNAIQGKNNYGLSVPLPVQGFTNATGYVPGIAPSGWFLLPAPSENTGTGTVANPITPSSPILTIDLPLAAVRAVITTAFTAGTCNVSVLWTP